VLGDQHQRLYRRALSAPRDDLEIETKEAAN
jgi:hypothetical protein